MNITKFDDLPDVLTVDEAASVLRIGRSTAYELVHLYFETAGSDGIPAIRLGSRIRVLKEPLRELLNAGRRTWHPTTPKTESGIPASKPGTAR